MQRVVTCPDEEGCTVIECTTDESITDDDGNVIHEAGAMVWRSHAPDTTHADCRANPDYPLEGGDSSAPMCADCAAVFTP